MRPLSADRRAPPLRDPAPSRWAYRLNRLWLTPVVRKFLRVGLPGFAVAMIAGFFLSDETRQDRLAQSVLDLRRFVEERPEFTVRLMAIEGAAPELAEDIREVVQIDLPVSSFDLELEQMRQQIEMIDAVERAEIRVQGTGVLRVSVTERVPAVVWRSLNGLELLDKDGHRIAALGRRADRADLPLIVGEGADAQTPEALALWDAVGPIHGRVLGFARVAELRWDIILDRNQRIMLPQKDAIIALNHVIALNEAQDLLDRDISHVDFRNGRRPTLRLSPTAMAELRAMQGAPVKKDVRYD